MSQTIAVRLPDELSERLDALAKSTRRAKSVYIREAIADQIARIEWEQGILRLREAVRAGEEGTYTTDEVRRRLGLDG
jgi:RHH-type rel operon transcriptional repressor/antitoxin RelB